MVRTGLRVLGLSLVALAVLFVSAAPARAANVSCQVTLGGAANPAGPEGNVLEVVDNSQSVTHIYRKGDEIVVSNNAIASRRPAPGRRPPSSTSTRSSTRPRPACPSSTTWATARWPPARPPSPAATRSRS